MPRLLPCFPRSAAAALLLALFCPAFLLAGAQGPLRAAHAPSADRVLLPGNVHPLAQPHFEAGPVAASAPTGRLRVLFKRSAAREAELDRLLQAMRDPHAPEYRKRLTPEEFGARFGATDGQISAVSQWLRAQGFSGLRIPASRGYLEFSGRVGSVETAFHPSLRRYSVDGAIYTANAAEPSIPASLAPMVAGISPLNTFRAQALVHAAAAPERLSGPASPLLSDAKTGTVFVTPADAATIYNSPNKLNRNFAGGTERRGSGVAIGIAGYSDLAHDDYLNYRRQLLNEEYPPDAVDVVDGIDPRVLDQHDGQVTLAAAEIASALAPGATLYVYSSQSDLMENGYTNAIIRAIEDNAVDILELSYSVCESDLGANGNAQWNELWKQAAAQGITVVVAAGDAGSAGCDAGAGTASHGLAVNGLASSPYVIAVGGTDFAATPDQFRQSLADPGAPSFAGYMPESVWNDAIGNNPPGGFDLNTVPGYGPTVAAGGGGLSALAFCPAEYNEDGSCPAPLTGYPQPGFQANAAPKSAVRAIPDVSVFAGTNRQYAATWAICSDTQVAQAAQPIDECDPATAGGSFSVEGAGGTGTSAPAFAGMLALLLESERAREPGARLGLAANGLYNLAQTSPQAFHDITAGNNSVPCDPGSPDCAGNGFLAGHNAGQGYDLASGLGSVDLSALVAAWPTLSYTPTTLALQANNQTTPLKLQHGDPVEFEAQVSPGSSMGTIAVTSASGQAGLAVDERIDLANGEGAASTQKLPGGTYSVQGYYAGDATHAASTSAPISITVNPEDSVLKLSMQLQDPVSGAISTNTSAFSYGTYGDLFVQPVGVKSSDDGPATGTVTLLNNGAKLDAPSWPGSEGSASVQTLNSIGRAAYPLNVYSPGIYQITASYGGDASYGPSSTATPLTLIIGQAQTNLTAQSSSASVDVSGSVTITAVLSTRSTGQYPSGGILLSANGTAFPGSITQSLAPGNFVVETAVFQVAASALALGTNTLTASYAGDTNYLGSKVTLTVDVEGTPEGAAAPGGPGSFSLLGPQGGITLPASATTAAGSVTLKAVNGFTGSVSLSCAWKAGQNTGATTCTVDPSATLAASGSANATVTVSVPPTTFDPNAKDQKTSRLETVGGGIALCSVLMLTSPVRRRASAAALLLLAAVGLLGTIGCGVSYVQGQTRQSGIFTAVISGTSGSLHASTEVLVHVK